AIDMGKVLVALRHEKIFPARFWNFMRDEFLGMDGPPLSPQFASFSGNGKTYAMHTKNGAWEDGKGAGLQTQWLITPEGPTAVLFVNPRHGGPVIDVDMGTYKTPTYSELNLLKILREAFVAAN